MKPKTVARSGGASAAMPPADEVGFCAESIIMTPNGERRIRDLRPGDRIITRDCGVSLLRQVAVRRAKTRVVRIRAGSLGHTRPERDVTLPAGQPVFIRDWRARALFGAAEAVVPAARLVDGEFVSIEESREVRLFSLHFERTQIIYVDGFEMASSAVLTLATGDR